MCFERLNPRLSRLLKANFSDLRAFHSFLQILNARVQYLSTLEKLYPEFPALEPLRLLEDDLLLIDEKQRFFIL